MKKLMTVRFRHLLLFIMMVALILSSSQVFGEENGFTPNDADTDWRETFIQGTNEVIYYQVVDGVAIYEGDIVLGDPDMVDAIGIPHPSLPPDPASDTEMTVRSFFEGGVKKWPQKKALFFSWYEVPYSLKSSVFTRRQRIIIGYAMKALEDKCAVRFVPYSPSRHENYIEFIKGSGCYSDLGMQGGRQTVSLGFKCVRINTIVHELMHAMGFAHEHSRGDRDRHVRILWENIIPDKKHNFKKSIGIRLGPYDYVSIMHYPGGMFSRNGKPTILRRDKGQIIGGYKLSELDIKGLKHHYGGIHPFLTHAAREEKTPSHRSQLNTKNTTGAVECGEENKAPYSQEIVVDDGTADHIEPAIE